jgi:ribonuclease HII
MGPLAGPVVAAAVMLPAAPLLPGMNDSKLVPRPKRTALADEIKRVAIAVGIGVVEVEEIDELNIYRAGLEAMRRAVVALAAAPGHLLVDARTIPGIECRQTSFIKGDRRVYSIAAASVLAKVHRDELMDELDGRYPGYGFAAHAGYATAAHRAAIRRLGPSPAHRRSFTLV